MRLCGNARPNTRRNRKQAYLFATVRKRNREYPIPSNSLSSDWWVEFVRRVAQLALALRVRERALVSIETNLTSPNNYTCGIISGAVSAISWSIVQSIAQLSNAKCLRVWQIWQTLHVHAYMHSSFFSSQPELDLIVAFRVVRELITDW